ncbi:unnamed protein product [Discosporangium mesarthrocarpum]
MPHGLDCNGSVLSGTLDKISYSKLKYNGSSPKSRSSVVTLRNALVILIRAFTYPFLILVPVSLDSLLSRTGDGVLPARQETLKARMNDCFPGLEDLRGKIFNAADEKLPPRAIEAAMRILQQSTKGWEEVAVRSGKEPWKDRAEGFSIRALTGGYSNNVFQCVKHGGINDTVLLRIHGQGTEIFVDPAVELLVFKAVAEAGFGPALLGVFDGGRVEEFLPGKALKAAELRGPSLSRAIARSTAGIHKLNVEGVPCKPMIFARLEKYHRDLLKLVGTSCGGVDVVHLGQAISELTQGLEGLQQSVPFQLVFCHNDLQHGNIMYDGGNKGDSRNPKSRSVPPPTTCPTLIGGRAGNSSSCPPTAAHSPGHAVWSKPWVSGKEVSLIDFEFSGYNPRGYDLGNHFCEWMANYGTPVPHLIDLKLFPTREERWGFCQAYLAASHEIPESSVSKDEVEALVAEADAFSLASHFFWALWSMLQYKISSTGEFDFLSYAVQRLKAYDYFRDKMAPFDLPSSSLMTESHSKIQ